MKLILQQKVFWISLIGFLFLFLAQGEAHDHPEYFPEEELHQPDVMEGKSLWVKTIYYVWTTHDRIHWVFVILMLFSCYHFRYIPGRKLFKHPKACFTPDPNYTGERRLHQYHRFFWMANVILIGIHWTEVITGWRFGIDYTYTFSVQNLGILAEFLYVSTFTLWLFSCHFFRYFLSGFSKQSSCANCSMYHENGKFNKLHGVFMWLALFSMALLIILQGHL